MRRGRQHVLAAQTPEVTFGVIDQQVGSDDALTATEDDIERRNERKMLSQPSDLADIPVGIEATGDHHQFLDRRVFFSPSFFARGSSHTNQVEDGVIGEAAVGDLR